MSETTVKTYKPSDTALDKLRIERNELKERLKKLDAFMGQTLSELVEKVGLSQAALLVDQRLYMASYLKVLETRIDLLEYD